METHDFTYKILVLAFPDYFSTDELTSLSGISHIGKLNQALTRRLRSDADSIVHYSSVDWSRQKFHLCSVHIIKELALKHASVGGAGA